MFFKKKKKTASEEAQEFSERQEKLDDKVRHVEQKIKFKNRINKLKFPTYTKNLVAFIVGICLIDLQFTYILAFFDKVQIAEELSKQLCVTILGVAFVYMVRAFFDSWAENKTKNESKPDISEDIKDTIKQTVSNVITNAAESLGIPVLNPNDKHDSDPDESQDISEAPMYEEPPVSEAPLIDSEDANTEHEEQHEEPMELDDEFGDLSDNYINNKFS